MEQRIRKFGDFIVGHRFLPPNSFSKHGLVLIDLAHNPVRTQHQEKSDQGLIEARRCGHPQVAHIDQRVIDIGIDHERGRVQRPGVQRCLIKQPEV
ncbi:hypothetical protein D3C73_1380090 [compost metagenome]